MTLRNMKLGIMTLGTIKSFASRKLILAAVAATGLIPLAASAHDRDPVDFSFGHGDVRVDLDFGRDRCPPPVQQVTTDRVWVEPVYQTVCDRVWVEPVTRTVCDRVWEPAVTQDVCQRVWVEPVYGYRDVVHYGRHGREVTRERVCLSEGHWVDQHTTVEVTPGHFADVNRQEVVTPGHFENVDRQAMVTPGHYEDRQVAVAVPPWRR